jgi:hypothetical protein
MPKVLFYAGTAFCFFLALSSVAESARELQSGTIALGALTAAGNLSARAPWAILVGLVAGLAAAAIFLRMAALLAARNLFGAFLAVFSVVGGVMSLVTVLLLQARLAVLARGGAGSAESLREFHFVTAMMLGYFVSLSLLALRPYFRIQASRFLSALVMFPLPLFGLILLQELFLSGSRAPLPASSPASLVFFATVGLLFFSIAMHCIRHRHLFIELTNLRELIEGRVDPRTHPGRAIRVGGAAFDS